MVKNEIELKSIGAIQKLPSRVRNELKKTQAATQGFDGMRLTLALSYGARDELVQATKEIAERVKRGDLSPKHISADTIRAGLFTHDLPDPDLLIRTSGERRISNFLLWQLAYSELTFIDKPWPIFENADLDTALEHFSERERRFGLTAEQVQTSRLKPAS